jgi:hypothetical protein
MKTDNQIGVGVSSLQRFSLSLGHFRGFLRTSFFPKGMTTNTRRLKLGPSPVMGAITPSHLFWGKDIPSLRCNLPRVERR